MNFILIFDADEPNNGAENCGHILDSWVFSDGNCAFKRPYLCEVNSKIIKLVDMVNSLNNSFLTRQVSHGPWNFIFGIDLVSEKQPKVEMNRD